jgi:hypothetical protein
MTPYKGPAKSYARLCDEVLIARAEKQRSYHPLRPSSAGTCARRLAHELMGFEGKGPVIKEERKPSVERLLSLGHFVEEQVIGELKEIPNLAVRFQQQVVDFFELSNGHKVEGSLDAFLWSDETRGVLDAKTIGDRFHAAFFSKWDALLEGYHKMKTCVAFDENAFWVEDLPAFLRELGTEDSLYKNLIQVNGYACTPFIQARGCDHGSILRYNKNNSRLMEVRFAPSMEVFQQTLLKFNSIVEAVSKNAPETVAKERVLGSVDCAYCPYKTMCWPGAGKRDFYKNDKRWATRSTDLEKGAELEELFSQRAILEKHSDELRRVETAIIVLVEGHNAGKVKLQDGSIWEVKQLAKSAELRRTKE